MVTLNVEECAAMLKVERKMILRLAGRELRGTKIGRAWVFLESDVLDFLRDRIEQQMATNTCARLAKNEFSIENIPTHRRRRATPKRVLPPLPEQ
jgi:hypothetical protein